VSRDGEPGISEDNDLLTDYNHPALRHTQQCKLFIYPYATCNQFIVLSFHEVELFILLVSYFRAFPIDFKQSSSEGFQPVVIAKQRFENDTSHMM
jgi:hypothetical protein